jgi:hypothetical protein
MRFLRLISKFLNSAFGLWLLSSVVLGVFLSIASEEQRCYSTAKTIIPKIAKSASERDLRILAIYTVIHSNKPTSETLAAIKSITNGTTYFYQDYKGTSLMDLEFNLMVSDIEILSLGQKKRAHPDALRNEVDVGTILQLSGLETFDVNRAIDKLKAKMEPASHFRSDPDSPISVEGFIEQTPTLTEFPYVFKRTQAALEDMFGQSPCQPISLIRDRIRQYIKGLE